MVLLDALFLGFNKAYRWDYPPMLQASTLPGRGIGDEALDFIVHKDKLALTARS